MLALAAVALQSPLLLTIAQCAFGFELIVELGTVASYLELIRMPLMVGIAYLFYVLRQHLSPYWFAAIS